MAAVDDVIRTFEGNTHTGDEMGLKLSLLETNEIDKENDKLYISVSDSKDIIDHFSVYLTNMARDNLNSW